MEKFINNHPFISLMMLSTICTTIGRIIRPDAFKNSVSISGPRNEECGEDDDLLQFNPNIVE